MKQIWKAVRAAGIFCFLLLSGGSIYAQEPSSIFGIGYGNPETFAEFHGFINEVYFDFENDGERNDQGDSTFDQHYFYFNAIAKIRQNVTVFGEIEHEHGGETIALDRAFMDWRVLEERLNIRIGKFYAPFGIEIQDYQYPTRKSVSRPMMARNLVFNEWTEVGVEAYGRFGDPAFSVDYDVALVNGPNGTGILEVGTGDNPLTGGTGDARQTRDNNSSRTFIGRVSANMLEGLTVGFSHGGGRYTDTGVPGLDFGLTGVDAAYRKKGLDLRGEWVTRKVDLDPTGEMKSNSYYVQASYKMTFRKELLNYIEPVLRYDFLEPDEDLADDQRTRYAAGINYSPYPHFKFGAEWQKNSEEGVALDDNGFLIQAVVDF